MKKFSKMLFFISVCMSFMFLMGTLPFSNQTVLAAEKVIEWKCQSHWPAASASYTGSFLPVIKRINEKTKGRLILEPFAVGSLVPANEIFNAVKRGMVPLGTSATAYYRDQIPLMNVASGLPMNLENEWEAVYFHRWLGFEKMLKDECKKHGVYYSTDRVDTTELALKKPVRKVEDFKGMKIRSSGVTQVFLASLGVATSALPGSEIYAALASGVVEGAHWGAVQGNDSMAFYDICKYHMRPALNIAATNSWLINEKELAKLPEDIQKIIVSTLEEHFFSRTNQYIYLEAAGLPKLQKEKRVELITLPPAESAKMKKAAFKIWDDVAKKDQQCAKAVQMLKEFNKSLGR